MARPKGDGETPKRNVRVPDYVWVAAKARAKREHTTISTVIVEHLRRYGAGAKAARRMPQLPDEVNELFRQHRMDAPGGLVFPRTRKVQLKTYVMPAERKVLLDSAEVTRLLRALAAPRRHTVIAEELQQIADQLDLEALTALDEQQK